MCSWSKSIYVLSKVVLFTDPTRPYVASLYYTRAPFRVVGPFIIQGALDPTHVHGVRSMTGLVWFS